MPDEACTTYSAMIDQLTLGHQFLLNTFGVRPTKGWQIDPFGASSVTPIVYKLAGFNGHIVDRITNKQDYANNQELQFNWQGSPSLGGPQNTLFSEMLGGDLYCDWIGAFDFSNDPVNPGNVASWGQKFVNMVNSRIGWYKTPNLLAEWGCDFAFQNADPEFDSMDQVVQWLQQNAATTGINVKYATLSDYFTAVNKSAQMQGIQWELDVGGDYFPLLYGGKWWSGYFTSRTELKGFVRNGEATSLVAEPLLAAGRLFLSINYNSAYNNVTTLRVANGDAQHHDGVTGTSVPNVVQMYKDDLIIGITNALQTSSTILSEWVSLNASANPSLQPGGDAVTNIRPGQSVPVVVYNPLGWNRSSIVAIPVNSMNLAVTDTSNNKIQSSILPAIGGNQTTAYILYFPASSIPAVGYSTYIVTRGSTSEDAGFEEFTYEEDVPKGVKVTADVTLENSILRVVISGATGRVSSIFNKVSGVSIPVDENLFVYTSTASGAYAFHPAGPAAPLSNPSTTVYKGTVVTAVSQVFDSAHSQTIRLYTSGGDADIEGFLEISLDLGPLPSHTEVIARFSTGVSNGRTFYTDANGYQYLERNYEWSTLIGANYYPIVYGAYIRDTISQLSVVTERSHGGSSLGNGQLEVMVHRNPDMGDGFGPGLTDTTEVFPSLRVLVDTPQASAAALKRQQYLMNYPVAYFSSTRQWQANFWNMKSLLGVGLPKNIHLQAWNSLDQSSNRKAIVRFVHIFAIGEDIKLSQPVTLDLTQVFSMFGPSSIVETTVSANAVINSNPGWKITMNPSQIRTFIIGLTGNFN